MPKRQLPFSRMVSPGKALSRFRRKAGRANSHEVMRQANRRSYSREMRVRTDEYSISVLARSNPFEREWLGISGAELKNLKFVESRLCLVFNSLLGLGCFLDGVFVFLTVGRPFLLSFERYVSLGKVDSDERNADWIAASSLELIHLINQIVNHAIDLFDHRFCENLRFRTDLDGRDWAARHQHSFFR